MAFGTRRRQRRTMHAAASRPRVRHTLRASASKLKLDNKKALQKQWQRRQEWQEEAWAYFDDVPEIKYSVWYQGNVMAKARWFVGVRNPDDPEADPIPVSDPQSGVDPTLATAAMAELARLSGPLGGISEIVRELNMNLEIAAECFLVGFGEREIIVDGIVTDVQPEEWDIKSVSEVDKTGDAVKIKSAPNDQTPRELDPDRDTVIRIWQRHPRWSELPDGNMRGVLSECEGLTILSNLVKAEAKSRIPAGIFTLPNELGQGEVADDTDQAAGDDATTDPLMEELYAGFTDPIEDPSSASAVSPIFIRGPMEALNPNVLRHITIGRDSSKDIDAKIEARVQRIARGLNLPVEVVMGHQQTTFTNAQQISEDEYTKHFQPRLVLVADALTIGFLHPNLLDDVTVDGLPRTTFNEDAVAQLVVWYDPVDMVKQADPLESATEALGLDVIGEEAYRRLKGFSEDDAPDPEERLFRTILHLRSFDPGVSTAILELMGFDLNIPESLPGTTAPPATSGGAAAAMLQAAVSAKRAGEKLDERALLRAVFPMLAASAAPKRTRAAAGRRYGYDLMVIDRELRTRLQTAASNTLTRILERAGNRLRNKIDAGARHATRDVDALHLAATIGRPLVAAAGFNDDDLIDPDAWDALEEEFRAWGAQAQARALAAVKQIVGLTEAAQAELEQRQFANLDEAWSWMKDALHDLAVARLYGPDPLAPTLGEFDPTSRVPTGLVRQAISRAGGATDLVATHGDNPYVVLAGNEAPGGIGTGELIMGALSDGGAVVEGYEWVYGPAFRLTPFEDHEALDGEEFTSFDSDVLYAGDWIGEYYFPGDHDGCCCDIAPTIIPAEDVSNEGE